MLRRQLRILIGFLLVSVAGNAFAGTLGLKEPYEEAEYRLLQEEKARAERIAELQESVPQNMSLSDQRKHLERFTDKILAADSVRERLRAHANLLAMVEPLHAALDAVVRDNQADVSTRSVALWALGERGSERACASLDAAQPMPEGALYNLALATARGRCGSLGDLGQILVNGTEFTRPRAAVVLGMLGARQMRTAVMNAAERNEDRNYDDYYTLARGLLGDTSTIDALHDMLNHRELHLHAAIALARMDQEYIVFDLLAAILSPEALVRWAAAKELIPIAGELFAVCEQLERFAVDNDLQIVELHKDVEEYCY